VGSRVPSVPVAGTYDTVQDEVSVGHAGVSVGSAGTSAGTDGISVGAAGAYGVVRVYGVSAEGARWRLPQYGVGCCGPQPALQ
jgi:hypothetical protein